MLDTDVLIVGGGIAGCSTALYAARQGMDVVLVEERDLHTGTSGANAGNLNQQLLTAKTVKSLGWEWVTASARMVRYYVAANAQWRELAAELDCPIELQTLGGISLAETEADMAVVVRKAKLEREHGGDSIVLSKNDLRQLAPYLGDDLVGGCYSPGERKVNPLLGVPAIVRLAIKEGARLFRYERVETILPAPSGGYEVTTNHRRIRCRQVVLAAGAGAPRLAAQFQFSLPITTSVIQTAVTEAVAPVMSHLLYHISKPLTMKQVANGNVVVGGGWPGVADPKTGFPLVKRESIAGSMWIAQRVVPAVSNLHQLRAWAAYIFSTPDGFPICGPVPGFPGLFMNIPNHIGFTMGPLLGRLTSELVAGRQASLDMNPFQIGDNGLDFP